MERNKPPELLLGFSTRKAANSKTGDITFHQLNKMRIGILNLPPTWSAQSFLLSSSSPPCTMGNRFWRSGRGWAERHLVKQCRLTSATNTIVKDPKGMLTCPATSQSCVLLPQIGFGPHVESQQHHPTANICRTLMTSIEYWFSVQNLHHDVCPYASLDLDASLWGEHTPNIRI